MFLLKSTSEKMGILIPEQISEITPELLSKLAANIKLAPYYALIATIPHTNLFQLSTKIGNSNSKEGIVTTHLIANYNIPTGAEKDVINCNIGDTAIITMTDYQMSCPVSVGSAISTSRVLNYINNNPELRKQCAEKKYSGNLTYHNLEVTEESVRKDCSKPLYTIDFRIIALHNIHAVASKNDNREDPMVVIG